MTSRQDRRITAAVEQGKAEIEGDIARGLVPADIRTFAALHEFCDANLYGGVCDDDWPRGYAGHAMAVAVHNALDAWVREGRPTI
jgi:hypothetical protein